MNKEQTRQSSLLKITFKSQFKRKNHQELNALFRFLKFDIKRQRYQKIDQKTARTFAIQLRIFARTQREKS